MNSTPLQLRNRGKQGARLEIWSRIEPGAVTDAAVCRSLPLLAEQEL